MGEAPAVDVPTAKELIDAVHHQVTREELLVIAGELERKAAGFAHRLGPERIGALGDDGLGEVLRSMFATRRRQRGGWLGARDGAELRGWVENLLYGDGRVDVRFDAFCGAVALEPQVAAEAAAELLHFSAPERWRLWTRWIWSPDARTGALPLVVSEEYDLDEAHGLGATYERVGGAMAAVERSPEAASFRGPGGGALGADLFLACVYSVYMDTVLGLKMSREFNAIVPPLPQLVRRLLGTHAMEV